MGKMRHAISRMRHEHVYRDHEPHRVLDSHREKEEHQKTAYVESDSTYHWYRCKLTDCPYKFESQKHYGGNANDGYCEFEFVN